MTPRDPLISERSLLVRTLRPIVPGPSPDAVVRDVTAVYPWGADLTDPDVRITRMAPRVALPPGTPLRGLPVLARRKAVPHRDRARYALMRAEGREVFPVTVHPLRRRTVELSAWIRDASEARGWTRSPEEREVTRERVRAYRRRSPRLR
ncbi:hypothetical protein [Nocardiopsis lambiniae]|uniref:Uncharacterized protein n=1 Tax=Nocardiopsis lambiniae TaxID=3075539 RepID=A0ABU2M4U2_9ACTN|nr:hypothetical protein [Nocardiopsis sp. DSM 44743]MDT0327598.1 hypothetical protein [Nocardiopsis sp. DSM 44743]